MVTTANITETGTIVGDWSPKMRRIIVASLTALSLGLSPAYADHGYYRDYHEHYHRDRDNSAWLGLAVVGAIAGLAIMADQNRPHYTTPAYVEPAYPPPPVYQPPPAYAAPAPDAPGTAYYCGSSGMYYPQTRACPEGWQAVPPRQY